APAARHRQGAGAQPGHLPVRRLVLRARLRDRRGAARAPRDRDAAGHGRHRRAAGQHDPQRRPDHRARQRPHRRPGDTRGTDGIQRDVPRDRALAAHRAGGSVNGQGRVNGERPSAARGPGPGGPPAAGPARWMSGPSLERAKDFKGSLRRLLSLLRPERALMIVSVICATGSVAASVWGPKVLGDATNIIFAGFISKNLPPGTTQSATVQYLRTHGQGTRADLIGSLQLHPGHGIDFDALGRVLGVVALIYLVSLLLGSIQGRMTARIVQRAMFRLREQAQEKLARLPLSYFDGLPRGEVLSRVTNDIDNLAQNMQQTLSQLILSVLTIVGVLAFMIWISWLLALIALVTVPLSIGIARFVAKKSKPQFIKQWSTTGKLNGHIEEMYTGHTLVKVFGRQSEAAETFDQHNDTLYNASFRAQFIAGAMQPAM